MLRWSGKNPLKVFFVSSYSKEGKVYKVELWGDGSIICECPAGTYRRKGQICPHAHEKRDELTAIFGGIQEAVEHYINLKKQKNGS